MGWRVSTRCASRECVQVAAGGGAVLVRDSAGTVLAVSVAAWRDLTGRIRAMRTWMRVTEALRSPDVSTDDKLAIGAACIEEEALMRTAVLIAGQDRAPGWYVAHGGRFRFSGDGEDAELMVEVPVRPFALAG